jgi:glycosyltransferase involved in cell wall biosynthesis
VNLLIVTETYPPEINGVARTLAEIVDGLNALGHRIVLVKPAQREKPVLHPDNELLEVKGLPLPGYPGLQFGMPAGQRLRQLLAERSIDAAYIATEGPLGYSALRACEALSVPALSGLHTNFHEYSSHYGAGLLAPILLRHLRRFHNRLAGTLVPTRAMAEAMVSEGFERLHVWPRGVHADLFTPQRRDHELRGRWGLSAEDIAVLYVGRIAPEKNIDTAFNAFAKIRQQLPGARMILVGSGPAEARLRDAHPDAVFAGPQIGDSLARHYASGDLFLFPSQTETFGNVTLEAMASGLPVVSYDLAAAHELIEHGRNGLLADPANEGEFIEQAVRAANNSALRRSLAGHARETALQQAWPTLITRLEKLFLAVTRERGVDDHESTAASTERP